MAPNNKAAEENLEVETEEHLEKLVGLGEPQAEPWDYELIYPIIVIQIGGHALALYGIYLCFTSAMWQTIFFNWLLLIVGMLGITAGVHRLWTHRAYKAKMPLQILLMLMFSVSCQYTAITWARDHRMHHRYCDTDADPYNPTRGFFFSHLGWTVVKKHPEVRKKGKSVDMSDIEGNSVLKFQKKYAFLVMGGLGFVLPTLIPIYYWSETFNNALILAVLRFFINLNIVATVNSTSHRDGAKPYDAKAPGCNSILLSFITLGESYHNYHHVYPWDYRTAELGNNWLNLTTKFIDFFAWIGWAYDRKTVPVDVAKARAVRTGDGTNEWGFRSEVSYDQLQKNYNRVFTWCLIIFCVMILKLIHIIKYVSPH